MADHSSSIIVNIFLDASPPTRTGFSTPLFIVDQVTNSLNGAKLTSYDSASAAATAQGAGYISATTLAFLQAGFSQQPTPRRIKVAKRNTAASETYAALLAATDLIDTDWYGVAQYSRADVDIVALATEIETRKKVYVAQSGDASWLDAGLPAGLTTLAGKERTAVLYHDTAAQPGDLAWLASRLVFDADNQSTPWDGEAKAVAALATTLTGAQIDAIIANKGNVGARYGAVPFWVDPGQSMNGRALYEIMSGDWFEARVREDIMKLKADHSAHGRKLLVNADGQGKILGLLNARLEQGVGAEHFEQGQYRATAEDITDSDKLARKLRFKVESQVAISAIRFEFNVHLQQTALQQAA
jgi:hypothetical protein